MQQESEIECTRQQEKHCECIQVYVFVSEFFVSLLFVSFSSFLYLYAK